MEQKTQIVEKRIKSTIIRRRANIVEKEAQAVESKESPTAVSTSPQTEGAALVQQSTDITTAVSNVAEPRFIKLPPKPESKIPGIPDLTSLVTLSDAEKEEEEKKFEEYRNNYQNESIGELVKNMAESNRIIEKDGKLIQKIFPIYKIPDPEHLVDFDAQFYMPAKHFLNKNIDTLYFNLGVIWSMTILLALTLYFEILRKIIDGLGNISNPIPKRM